MMFVSNVGDGTKRSDVNIIDVVFHDDDVPLEIRLVVLRSNELNNMMMNLTQR